MKKTILAIPIFLTLSCFSQLQEEAQEVSLEKYRQSLPSCLRGDALLIADKTLCRLLYGEQVKKEDILFLKICWDDLLMLRMLYQNK